MVFEKISLVVFDMAGTTVLDRGEIETCFYEACTQTGLAGVTRADINAMMGWSKIEVFKKFWTEELGNDHPKVDSRVTDSYERFKDLLETHYRESEQQPTSGTVQTINWLREGGVKVALTTGFYRAVTDIILNKLRWDQGLDANHVSMGDSFIDMSITSDEVASGRPAPFMIQKAMKQFGITSADKVIKIGDTPVDLAAGRNANCLMSLAVTNGSHSKQELEAIDNDGLLPSIGQLKAFLDNKLT